MAEAAARRCWRLLFLSMLTHLSPICAHHGTVCKPQTPTLVFTSFYCEKHGGCSEGLGAFRFFFKQSYYKDRLAIAIRSLKDRRITTISLTQVLVSCVAGVVLESSSILYGKVPRLAVKNTNRLTQAVVFFRRHYYLCGALLCTCSSAERGGPSTHVQRECSAEPFMCSILSRRIFTSLPGSRIRFFIAMQIQYSY